MRAKETTTSKIEKVNAQAKWLTQVGEPVLVVWVLLLALFLASTSTVGRGMAQAKEKTAAAAQAERPVLFDE